MIEEESIKMFLNNTTPEPNTGCWLWEASLSRRKSPVGSFYYEGKAIYAHRFSYMAFKGPIKNGFCVCHKCDTPACVNPDHLFLGTQIDNINDRHNKRRSRGPKGSTHGNSKLTEELVLEIKKDRILKKYSYMDIANRYGCSKGAIAHILKGRAWKHVVYEEDNK